MLAQHLTPPEVASLAASMFDDATASVSLLDLGAGTGMLSVAAWERYHDLLARADGIELDPILADVCDRQLRPLVTGTVVCADAVESMTYLTPGLLPEYDRIILNPPYKKMAAGDYRQAGLPARSPNLYSAFLMQAVEHLTPGGEVVAIVPRSWTNGEYFAPFRRWLLSRCSLDAMHVYGSRGEVFQDTDVLQETMIVRLTLGPQSPTIRVSTSATKGEAPTVAEYPTGELVIGADKIVRVEPFTTGRLTGTVADQGLCASTGKVVDFRSRDHITDERPVGVSCVPLVYAGNFPDGALIHPLSSLGKGQWFRTDDDWARRQVLEPGCYVVVRRFSAKEERRRVVAYPLVTDHGLALENHCSYVHAGTSRRTVSLRSPELAHGLAIWLGTTLVDDWFRGVSGSTQVNARDIKAMPCPDLDALEALGASWHRSMTQDEVDDICRGLTG